MKKLFISLLVIFYTFPVFAQSKEPDDICLSLNQAAHLVMFNRQSGMSITTLIDTTRKLDDATKEAMTNLIYAAYEIPLVADENQKNIISNEFANTIALECYKRNSNDK